MIVSSSVILGYLTEHLALATPSDEDTRNAYLLALGKKTALMYTFNTWFAILSPMGDREQL